MDLGRCSGPGDPMGISVEGDEEGRSQSRTP